MQLKIYLSTLCFLLILGGPKAIWANVSSNPSKCPNIKVIKTRGLEHATKANNGKWLAMDFGKYDTENDWGFVLGEFTADNEREVLVQAKKSLKTLSFVSGPEQEGPREWRCYYATADGYRGIAMTPLILPFSN